MLYSYWLDMYGYFFMHKFKHSTRSRTQAECLHEDVGWYFCLGTAEQNGSFRIIGAPDWTGLGSIHNKKLNSKRASKLVDRPHLLNTICKISLWTNRHLWISIQRRKKTIFVDWTWTFWTSEMNSHWLFQKKNYVAI